MKHKFLLSAILLAICLTRVSAAIPTTLDSIRNVLDSASTTLVQEKAYVHLDNTCYFIGDTIWYKAYVMRADNLHFTDMSRILYVELLSPDGLVVERQQLIINDKGYCCGDFALKDSLYSGFYEIRAYTRWMLNFNVTEHMNLRKDRESFYNFLIAKDYFRQYDALYSRVIPIYNKPDSAGNYSYKRMYARPKQRIVKSVTEELKVTFYPEGGHIINGKTANIAFEAVNQEGEEIDIKGNITNNEDNSSSDITTTYMGKGVFTLKADGKKYTAHFKYNNKDYSFDLPKAEEAGATIKLTTDGQLTVSTHGLTAAQKLGLSVLCRGKLVFYDNATIDTNGEINIKLPFNGLPTGVNDLTLFDNHGQILADRLFFINHHDFDRYKINISGQKQQYKPYEKISLDINCPNTTEPVKLSIAVRDNRTDELSYNNGNMLTDILLSSELKGFVAYPGYYFESDDATHKQALDLLMMVQGWRRYNWTQLADTVNQHPRYKPETAMTVEGSVLKTINFEEVLPEEVASWLSGMRPKTSLEQIDTNNKSLIEQGVTDPSQGESNSSDNSSSSASNSSSGASSSSSSDSYSSSSSSSSQIALSGSDYNSINNKGLKHEVNVKMDMVLGEKTGTVTQLTKNGHYWFSIPPFYGDATLFIMATNPDKSAESLKKYEQNGWTDEDQWPEYYVKRDLFYPIFARKYSYYENHQPEWKTSLDNNPIALNDGSYMIKNVNVKAKGHGTRSIDYTKPAWVGDAYDMYNNITDYGLSFGKLDFRTFPIQICSWLYGNMGRYRHFNVQAKFDGHTFFRNYSPDSSTDTSQNRSNGSIFKNTKLKRLMDIKIYTDFEPRNEEAQVESRLTEPDFTVDFITMPDDGERYTYRDRNFMLHGFYEPDEFYKPDYSNAQPQHPNDYRRTLYWNPNAKTDANGHFNATFFNNSKETDIVVSAEGVTTDGKIMVNK